MRKMRTMGQILTGLCIGRQPIEHFQPIDEHPSVMIGCNPRQFPEAVRTVDTGSCSQNPQNVPPPGDALTKLSPLSLPQISGKTSEKGDKIKDAQTFENDSILGAPKVAEKLRDLASLDMYKFRLIS